MKDYYIHLNEARHVRSHLLGIFAPKAIKYRHAGNKNISIHCTSAG